MELKKAWEGGFYWKKGDLISFLYLNKKLAYEDRFNDCIIFYLDGEEQVEG